MKALILAGGKGTRQQEIPSSANSRKAFSSKGR